MISLSSIAGNNGSIETLIQQYMALERQPILQLSSKKAALNTKSAVFTDMQNKLKALQDAAEVLGDTSNSSIFNAVQVTSDDTDALTVTAGTDSAQGQYVFRTRQLATATRMKSTADLNTHKSVMSSNPVVGGLDELDTDEAWADAGFETTPDGTVTINSISFTLADYTSVDNFMGAVNDHATANANIFYDSTRDKFFIEGTDENSLIISETGTNGFLTEANITADTYSTNVSGLEAGAYLHEINFDTGVSESDSGSFKINGTTIEWDADTDTLNSVLYAINHSDAGVTAFYDDSLDRVSITSDTMGSDTIQLEDLEEGTFLGSTLMLSVGTQTAGQDAKFTINSTDSSDEITKSSNTFTINGLIFTLRQATVANDSYSDSGTTTVTVASDKDESALKAKINTFLSAYNSVIDYIKAKTGVDTTTYTRGALAGESVFRDLKSDIIGMLLGQVSGIDSNKPSYLADIGITLDENLHASISDASDLSDWLDDDPDAVADLFNSTNGVAAQMEALLEPYTESYGIIYNRKESVSDRIEIMDDRIERLEERMERREAYYRRQFSALQETLSMVNYQQSVLSSLTSSLNNILGSV